MIGQAVGTAGAARVGVCEGVAVTTTETERAARLVDAEQKAAALFTEVARRGLITPGRRESAVSDDVRDLGAELFGTRRHWHKRPAQRAPGGGVPARVDRR